MSNGGQQEGRGDRAMRALAIIGAAVVAFSVGAAGQGRPSARNVSATAMSAAETNGLIRSRCVVCHNTLNLLGGLNLELYDAVKPDPGVALMMSIKVSKD